MGSLELQVWSIHCGGLGRHCCLFCAITSTELKTPPTSRRAGSVQQRTLETLKADHSRFLANGAIHSDTLFDIPLDQVHYHMHNNNLHTTYLRCAFQGSILAWVSSSA